MLSRQWAKDFGNIFRPHFALITNNEQNTMRDSMWTGHKDGRFGGVLRAALAAVLITVLAMPANAGPREQAKRIHERLAGVPPTDAVLVQMQNAISSSDPACAQYGADRRQCAAYIAMENSSFYNVTLKNFAAPWTNRDRRFSFRLMITSRPLLA